MILSLRQRLLLTLLPLLALLALIGGSGYVLLDRLAGRIDLILRENYDSVRYMERLGEALERMDSALQFAMVGREQEGLVQYRANRKLFEFYVAKEEGNITLPGENALARRLRELGQQHQQQADQFFLQDEQQRRQLYFGQKGAPGLLDTFKELKMVSGDILRLNQDHMEKASQEARESAASSLTWLGAGLILAGIAGGWLALRTVQSLLNPIQAVTRSAVAIGHGDLNQMVPVVTRDELGQLAGAFNQMVRELRSARQSQETRLLRLQQASQATISAFPYPVLLVDQQGQVEQANPAARRLLGVSEESSEADLLWLPPEPLREPLEAALHQQRDYLPEGFDATFILSLGGAEHWFLPRIFTIADPQQRLIGAAVVLVDVTRFRLLDQVKSNLVATVSHELKTPLTSIQLVVHLLLDENVGPLTPKQLELVLDARENTQRLLAMINNLLDLARLERGGRGLDRQPIAPAEVLAAAAERVRPRADARGIHLVLEAAPDLPSLLVDARQLSHALDNLLDNALRYTSNGGTITLRAAASDSQVSLLIADTGSGISAEYLPHVFERFFRVPGQLEIGGTGLGLAIVREIVTAHGGHVECQSEVGQGTSFTISLPR